MQELICGKARLKLGAVMGLAIFIAGSGAARSESLHLAARGTKVSGTFELGAVQIPLPAGEWTLAGRGEQQGSERGGVVRVANVYLVEIVDGKIVRDIWAAAPMRGQGSGTGWVRDKSVCDRQNTIANDSDNYFNAREQRCWSVNHYIASSPNNPSDALKDFYAFLAERTLALPQLRVVTEHSVNDAGPYLRVRYAFDPEFAKIPAGPYQRWESADWHKTRISGFPEKQTFANQVEAFGRSIQKLVVDGLRGRLDVGKAVSVRPEGWPS